MGEYGEEWSLLGTTGKTAIKEYALGLMGERRLRRRMRLFRRIVKWTQLLAKLDGSEKSYDELAPFFKRYFMADGCLLWVREPDYWQLVHAWPRILQEITPRKLAIRTHRQGTPREAFLSPPSFHSRVDLLIAHTSDKPLGWLTLLRQEDMPFTGRERTLLRKLMEHFAAHVSLQTRIRDAEAKALTDVLTAIWNRRFFEDRYPIELQRAHRYHRSLAVLMIDIDSFKSYNDTYGHLAGDQALQIVAQLLKSNLRTSDILCRYGGDEFVVLLPESDLEHALLAAEKLRRAVAAEALPDRHGIASGHINISIGVAACPENGISEADLLYQADRALYGAKETGRDRVQGASECFSAAIAAAQEGNRLRMVK